MRKIYGIINIYEETEHGKIVPLSENNRLDPESTIDKEGGIWIAHHYFNFTVSTYEGSDK